MREVSISDAIGLVTDILAGPIEFAPGMGGFTEEEVDVALAAHVQHVIDDVRGNRSEAWSITTEDVRLMLEGAARRALWIQAGEGDDARYVDPK